MKDQEFVMSAFEDIKKEILDLNRDIFAHPELSHEEKRSAQLIEDALEKHGFSVKRDVSGEPTAFIAQYGSGKPVIGYLGEYDALPGLSQVGGCPTKKPVVEGAPGHGCGHCALGTASLAAALLAAKWLDETKASGTIRYYGCCAEENRGAKPYMARDGYFDDVDAVYAWHPSNRNGVTNISMAAIKSIIIRYKGITAHAGATPYLGRSALDAAEIAHVGMNYLREHIIPEARLQYSYLDSADIAPNVIPDHCVTREVIRAPKMSEVLPIVERVKNCAKGAALMTGTECTITDAEGFYEVIQNSVVCRILSDAAKDIGAPKWSEADKKLAAEFSKSFSPEQKEGQEELARTIAGDDAGELLAGPLDPTMRTFDPDKKSYTGGASDVGDVAMNAPTANLEVATAAIGTPLHTWMFAGQVGSSIGEKGLECAGEIMGLAGIRTIENPKLLDGAQEERLAYTGGKPYVCQQTQSGLM
ncbi:MAG: amidohydrolase [Lachnospiraceae bacterium]|jgi:aminobenzoyl-glutamate utilization protein B